ncbi:MAG TPA: DNA polymerase III subunit delta' [Chloroflexia bacterium]|nr:DNA polymerase III subunit delta' [Chloroflexia bacterium]
MSGSGELSWPIVGHERAVGILRASIRTGRIAHAYLFTGLEGSGKHTLALAFAMAVNCQADPPPGQDLPDVPCGICASCARFSRGSHPDLVEVNLQTQAQAQGEGSGKNKSGPAKELRIDAIREMQANVGLSPHSARWKIILVDDAEKLNEEASNALLKTLEEPPAHTIIILLAPDEGSVLPTISSRGFLISLRSMSRESVAQALTQKWGADREQAELLAALSGGRLGYAVRLMEDRDGMDRRRTALQELSVLSGAHINDRVNTAGRFAKMFTEQRPALYDLLQDWEGWWRDVIAFRVSAPELVVNVDQLPVLESVARKHSPQGALAAIKLIQDTRQQLLENVNPRVALEGLALGMP